MKKFRRIILNSIRGKSIVQKFNSGDLHKPVEEVVYAMPPVQALTYYFMQFVMGDFAWEKYPRYIKGTIRSSKIKDVYYYDKVEGYLIRSSPYCGGEKWRFHKKPKKAVLPEKKKRLVLKKGENYAVTSREVDRSSGKVVDITKTFNSDGGTTRRKADTMSMDRYKRQNTCLRRSVFRGAEKNTIKPVQGVGEGEQTLKVAVECSRRPKLKAGGKNRE